MPVQRLNITLPSDLARDLRKSVPERSRSKFISRAVERELKFRKKLKIELVKSLKINAEFYKKEAEDWKAIEVENWPD
jgi:metal-responsive CopG/Arc/MetJ family transcriptional regulator